MYCRFCGEDILDDAQVCKSCGKSMDADLQKKVCPQCGRELEQEAKFCLKCGYGVSGTSSVKKKKIPLALIMSVLIIAVGAGGGVAYYLQQQAVQQALREDELEKEQQRQELIASYQSKAIEIKNAIDDTSFNFLLFSQMYESESESLITTKYFGEAVYKAGVERNVASQLSEEKTRKREVDSLYEELNKIGCEEEEIQELKTAIQEYYFSYCDRYTLLVEMDFTLTNFVSKNNVSESDFDSKATVVEDIVNKLQTKETIVDTEDGGSAL